MLVGDDEALRMLCVCSSVPTRCRALLSLKVGEIFVVGNVSATHRAQVRRFYLAIDDAVAYAVKPMGEEYQCEFRPIGHKRKHTFAYKASAHGDAVEPAHELVVAIHLHARSVAQFVKFGILLNHCVAQPSTFIIYSVVASAAIVNYALEIGVYRKREFIFVEDGAHRVRDVNLFGENHKTLHRAKPQNGTLAEGEPRKYTMAVGENEAVDREVAAKGKTSVGITITRVGKPYFVVKFY